MRVGSCMACSLLLSGKMLAVFSTVLGVGQMLLRVATVAISVGTFPLQIGEFDLVQLCLNILELNWHPKFLGNCCTPGCNQQLIFLFYFLLYLPLELKCTLHWPLFSNTPAWVFHWNSFLLGV